MTQGVCVAAAMVMAAACNRDLAAPMRARPNAPNAQARRVAAVAEITFRDIGSPRMTSSVIIGASVADVEAQRAALDRRAAGGARLDLTLPTNAEGPADSTIQVRLDNNGSVTQNDTSYFEATYRVRNANKTDSVAFDTPRRNLTFVAVADTRTLNGTAVLEFNKSDGTQADLARTLLLKPSGLVALNAGVVVPTSADVMQVFTELEVAAMPRPSDVTNVFPYGFVVRSLLSTTDRILPASPDTSQFDGIVTFAFRLPVQGTIDDPTSITVLMLALDDSQVRMTQSREEQTPPGPAMVTARANALAGLTQVRVLGGASVTGLLSGITTQILCSVRTAGPPNVPTASLSGTAAVFQALSPSPYTAAGQMIGRLQAISATFSAPVSGAGPGNFVVHGSITGRHFLGQAYNPAAGTTVTTPTPANNALTAYAVTEDLEVTVTSSLGCPAWVGRLKVAVPNTATPTLAVTETNLPTGVNARASAAGDFDRDGHFDTALRTTGAADGVQIVQGDAGPKKGVQGHVPVTGNTFTGSVVVRDFNGDGKVDVAFVNGNAVLVSLNGSTGTNNFTMGAATAYPSGALSADDTAQDLVEGDFNGDGIPDLVVWFRDHAAVLLGNGTGGFQPPMPLPTGAGTRAIVVGDMNQDGILDLVVANNPTTNGSGGTLTVWLGNGDGTFRQGQTVTNPNPIAGLAIGDLNNDGALDVATADSTSRSVTVRLGMAANGTLGDATVVTVAPPTTGTVVDNGIVSGIVLADISGAVNNLDAIIINGGMRITDLIGNGAGGFGSQITSTTNSPAVHISVADYLKEGAGTSLANLIVTEGLGSTKFNWVQK